MLKFRRVKNFLMDLFECNEAMITLTVVELGCVKTTFCMWGSVSCKLEQESITHEFKVTLKWKTVTKLTCINSGFIVINIACILTQCFFLFLFLNINFYLFKTALCYVCVWIL